MALHSSSCLGQISNHNINRLSTSFLQYFCARFQETVSPFRWNCFECTSQCLAQIFKCFVAKNLTGFSCNLDFLFFSVSLSSSSSRAQSAFNLYRSIMWLRVVTTFHLWLQIDQLKNNCHANGEARKRWTEGEKRLNLAKPIDCDRLVALNSVILLYILISVYKVLETNDFWSKQHVFA